MSDTRLPLADPESEEAEQAVAEAEVTAEQPADATRATDTGGDLEELVLASLVSAPEPLGPGTEIGPEGRLRVVEHLAVLGRVNRYAATWLQDDGQQIEVELREGPADHAGLQREAEILTGVQYPMLPRAYLACEGAGRRRTAASTRRISRKHSCCRAVRNCSRTS